MSMILKGQKNLEKEITQLKSEWSKDQSIRQINEQKVQEQR